MKCFKCIFWFLWGGKKINVVEAKCLQAWTNSLVRGNKLIAEEQIKNFCFLQRSKIRGVTSFFFCKNKKLNKLPTKELSLLHSEIILADENGNMIKVRVFTNNGILFSVEFTSNLSHLIKKRKISRDSLSVISVKHILRVVS